MMGKGTLMEILAPKIEGPEGPYRCIYLDPPWPERGGGKSKRGADRHYDTLTVRQIIQVVLDALGVNYVDGEDNVGSAFVLEEVASNAHCWMWVTDNYLTHGLDLMKLLGFKYKRTLVWAKLCKGNIDTFVNEVVDADFQGTKTDREVFGEFFDEFLSARKGGVLDIGLGQYARGSHELLLFGSKGKAHMPPKAVLPKSVQFAPLGEHSEKPALFHDIIEACSPGPRLEMFARRRREGWAVFGNEVDDG